MTSLAFRLHSLFNDRRRYSFPFEHLINEIPRNGIYIIFERGETFHGIDRIVRIGTHTGANQLRSRLNQHFVKENKNRSIFRKNIGRCFLNRVNSAYLHLWELDITSKVDKEKNLRLLDLDYEKQIEKEISSYIQSSFSFCVFEIDSKEDRLYWESNISSTLAQSNKLKPSSNWLGRYSTKDKIKNCGLWQVNGLTKVGLTNQEFEHLKQII